MLYKRFEVKKLLVKIDHGYKKIISLPVLLSRDAIRAHAYLAGLPEDTAPMRTLRQGPSPSRPPTAAQAQS